VEQVHAREMELMQRLVGDFRIEGVQLYCCDNMRNLIRDTALKRGTTRANSYSPSGLAPSLGIRFTVCIATSPDTSRLMDWVLHYRDAGQLVDLAERCGIRREQITIGKEPEHINLFLHVRF
jgi:hypothetical protein